MEATKQHRPIIVIGKQASGKTTLILQKIVSQFLDSAEITHFQDENGHYYFEKMKNFGGLIVALDGVISSYDLNHVIKTAHDLNIPIVIELLNTKDIGPELLKLCDIIEIKSPKEIDLVFNQIIQTKILNNI